ncbi:MAG: hypothetical protein ACI9JN_002348 [Bacteroidia bacterium]|jgi:hypothetical protein
MQWQKPNKLFVLVIILLGGLLCSSCGGRKAKTCPAYHESQRTGGTIDKNKKRKRSKVKQGVFGKKTSRKYRRSRR